MEYELITTVDVDSNGEEEKLASLPSTVEESSVSGENKSPEEREESHDASTNALLSESDEKEDSNQEENEQVGQQNMITENFSECLKSPIDAAVFSPSLDINDNGNLHGLGEFLFL